jgi:hypothetical protein
VTILDEGWVSDDRENPRVSEGSQAGIDLLELVRAAEEEATLAAKRRASSPDVMATLDPPEPRFAASSDRMLVTASETLEAEPPSEVSEIRSSTREQVVDVGDEAVDAPASLPPMRVPSERPATGIQRSVRPPAKAPEPISPGLPPAVGIALMIALAVGALVLVTR